MPRGRLLVLSSGFGAAALAAGALVVPGAAASTDICRTTSFEAAPSYGAAVVRSLPARVTVKVLHRRTVTTKVRRVGARSWHAKVRVSVRTKRSVARRVIVEVPTSVTSIATAECDGFVASATVTAARSTQAGSTSSRSARDSERAVGRSARQHRHAAIASARQRAFAKATATVHHRAVAHGVNTRQATVELTARAKSAGYDLAVQTARAGARDAAERQARHRGHSSGTPAPSTTSTPSPPLPSPTPTVPAAPPAVPPTVPPAAQRPLLIKHGWDIPTPSWMATHQAEADAVPFDGVVVLMPSLSAKTLSQTPISYEQFRAVLAPMPTLAHVKHNFVIVYATDLAATADWTVPVTNFGNLARAARDTGFEGIAFDGERYFGGSDNWPSACSLSLEGCQSVVRTNGQRMMSAVKANWPTGVVFSFMGPWVSNPETCQHTGGAACNDISWANELAGPFVAGLIDVGGSNVVDGGEAYTLRTPSQFAAFHAWQKQLAPTVSAGTGVYDQPWIGAPMDPTIWTTTLRNALASSDRYAWAYTERYDWWGTGWPYARVPTQWLDATRMARTP